MKAETTRRRHLAALEKIMEAQAAECQEKGRRKEKTMRKILMVAIVALALAAPLYAQFPMGNYGSGEVQSPEKKAADHLARGLKVKRKAEDEKRPEKRAKLLEEAKDELGKAVGIQVSFDGLLALGQVQLALGKKPEALATCSRALAWREDPQVRACILAASPALPPGGANPPGDR